MNAGPIATDTFEVFGTKAVLLLADPAAVTRARAIADQVLAEVDLACSRFRPDSELVRLNAAGGEALAISATFADLIAAALRAAALTGGDVDPTCGRALTGLGYDRDFADVSAAGDAAPRLTGLAGPLPGWRSVHLDQPGRRAWLDNGAQIDLGATAKAWAADRCAEQLADSIGCGVLVSLGGDVSVAGPPPPDNWRIRVTDDHADDPVSAPGQTVTISSGGLATSSTTVRAWTVGGRRVHHIIDPATGEPAGHAGVRLALPLIPARTRISPAPPPSSGAQPRLTGCIISACLPGWSATMAPWRQQPAGRAMCQGMRLDRHRASGRDRGDILDPALVHH
jgi:thiamine biosynthesis lipoprotein